MVSRGILAAYRATCGHRGHSTQSNGWDSGARGTHCRQGKLVCFPRCNNNLTNLNTNIITKMCIKITLITIFFVTYNYKIKIKPDGEIGRAHV